MAFIAMLPSTGCKKKEPAAQVPDHPTFTRHIAPIIYQNCSGCHRPGQSSPFPLLTFLDVSKHAKVIVDVVQNRIMPPWLPDRGHGHFVGERGLSQVQIDTVVRWANQGAAEGLTADLPPQPVWTDGWQLGPPDLVVRMPEPFTVPAEGRDVYRNFVIPIPGELKRFVRGVEIHPGSKQVHHAFLRFDRTRESMRLDKKDAEPGFGGMNTPGSAYNPGGQFLSWQPGKVQTLHAEGLAWPLEPHSDAVLQVHLQPSGKSESLQAEIGFYFTDRAPTNTPFKIGLRSMSIDIPAGITNYIVTDSYALPVDVDLIGILPHAHYLAKEMHCWATLPDGTTRSLLLIRQWDFKWQGDYRFSQPIFAPKGTKLNMRFTYDNSAGNPRNPNQPPKHVKYGVQTSDEMAEMWMQVLPRHPSELRSLSDDYSKHAIHTAVAYNEYLLRENPKNGRAHVELGKIRLMRGQPGALELFRAAVQLEPDIDEAHYHLGLMLEQNGDAVGARIEYETTIRLNPDFFEAHNNLGLICMASDRLAQAVFHFKEVLRINPGDEIALKNLDLVLARRPKGK